MDSLSFIDEHQHHTLHDQPPTLDSKAEQDRKNNGTDQIGSGPNGKDNEAACSRTNHAIDE